MKKNFILLGLAWLLSLGHASADNYVISNVTVPQGGTASLVIGYIFTSETDKVGFTLSMELPEGLSLQKDNEGDPVYVKDASINKLNILFPNEGSVAGQPSTGTSTITGTSGTLLTLTLVANASLEAGSELTIPVTKATFQQRVSGSVTDINVADFTFKVTIGHPADSRTLLDENSTTAPTASSGVVDVRVKRTIAAGNWSTICLPFAMNASQIITAFGTDVQLANFTGVDTDFDADDKVVGLTAKFSNVSAIAANHPYIIKVSSPVTEFTVDGVTIAPDEDGAIVEFDNGKTGGRRVVYSGLYGTYHSGTVVPEYCLFLSNNKFWYSKGLTTMKGFRAFFEFLDVLSEVDEVGVRMLVNIDGEETRIEGLSSAEAEEAVYDLNGRKVSKPQLHGVYIVNGKKVLK